ncbi:MAG: hypothetical protein ACRDTH_23100 [Pseudonocardiaceae bacterium]
MLTAALVTALMPAIPHPVLLLSGEQGTGKSTATKMLAAIVDPSPVQLRKPPRDAEAATTAAAGSWVVALDNLSGIPDWLSDCLCRWSTGDGDVRRRLYTDGDLHVIAFRRVAIINGIDLGALRGDLADRVVQVELDCIPDTARREDSDVAAQWANAHPRVLGALLDLTAHVLRTLPSVQLDEMPRMADFTRVLATVDQILGTTGTTTYLGLRDALAEDAITSDPVLIALTERIQEPFTGTSAELLTKITPAVADGKKWRAPEGWPANARSLTTILRRQAPTLRQLSWTVTELERQSTRAKVLRWHLTPPSKSKQGRSGRDDSDGQRRRASDAANAASTALSYLSAGYSVALGAANGAATLRQSNPDAAPAANDQLLPHHAADNAAATAPTLNSGNGQNAASAANAAPNPHLLGSPADDPFA